MRNNSPDEPIRVTFFGDSICVGQGVSIFRGWVTRIAQDLDELSYEIKREILVTNASVNGRTTRQALEDMPYDIQSHGVDILLIQFGLNDCNYWASDQGLPRVSRNAFVANLREIVMRGRRFGAVKVLLNNNHPTTRDKEVLLHTSITFEDSNRDYNQAVRELVTEMGDYIEFHDIEASFQSRVMAGNPLESFLLPDGLHLSTEGHDLYYSLMQPSIRGAVWELIGNWQKSHAIEK